MPVSPVLVELRAATARLHQAVETESDLEASLRDPASRPGAVGRFLNLHQVVDHGLAPWGGALETLGHVLEPRAHLIRDDLVRLGVQASAREDGRRPGSLGEALGWIYVAEGSVLGGRKMRRDMAADGVSLEGLNFLDPFGDATGTRWRTFLQTMESACASGRVVREDVVRGGLDGFRLAYDLLVPTCPNGFPE